MRTIFSLGPIETADGESHHICFSVSSEKGAISEQAPTALAALRKLHAKGATRDATCEPKLKAEARELGLKVDPLPEELVEMKAGMAVMLDHGGGLGANPDPDLVLDLIDAAVAFDTDEPWGALPPPLFIELQVTGVSPAARPCEAVIMGADGQSFGITLYYQRGAVAQVEGLLAAGRQEEARSLEMLMLFLDREPEFVTQAVEDFAASPIAPHAFHLRRGQPVRLSREDLEVLTAALHAIRGLAAGDEEGMGSSGESLKVQVVARLRRPGAPAAAPPPQQPSYAKVGRNDPCPCGSGKKFKRCHAGTEQPAEPAAAPGVSTWHGLDERLQAKVGEHALQRFGRGKLQAAAQTLHGDHEPAPELLIPWSIYEFPIAGNRSAAEVFRSDKGETLDAKERELLDAQLASRITVLEVLEVRPEEGLRLLDLFSGESFFVKEKTATRSVIPRELLLGRTILVGGEHLIAGIHQSALPPEKAEGLVEKLGGATNFGLPPRPPPPAPELVRAWDETVDALARELASPMVMTNTDGEPILLVEQTFTVKRGTRDELVDRLAGLEHVIIEKDTASAVELTFTKPGNAMHAAWKSTVLGSAKVTKSSLVLNTNSDARAAALRARIEAVAGHLLTYKSRKDEKPPQRGGGQTVAVDSEAGAMLGPIDPESLHARANRDWMDQPLPELGNRTARDAVKEPALRWKVHRMLCGLEHGSAQSGALLEEAKLLRKQLGLDELGQVLPNFDLHLATGLGRRISACLLEVAEPFMAMVKKVTPEKAEMAMDVAVKIWNAAVLEAQGQSGELAALRGRIVRGGMDPANFDAAVAIRKRWHAHDLRMISDWRVERQAGGGFMFLAQASMAEDLVRRAREAGIQSTSIVPGGAAQADF